MYSERPKVLHILAGKTLLKHVLDTATKLSPNQTLVVYGYGGKQVPDSVNDPELMWVEQTEQLGTGHAVMKAAPKLAEENATLVLYGDVPLISSKTLSKLVAISEGDKLGVLTINLPNPEGYGRIVRNNQNQVIRIVEHKDATDNERKIQEINTGIVVIPSTYLSRWMGLMTNNNSQKEYYLTDIIEMAANDHVEIVTCEPEYEWEVLGVNSKVQLANLERVYQNHTAQKLLEQGVTLSDPARIDIRGELNCGKDVIIDINCIFEGNVTLGNNVSVGANTIIRDSTIEASTYIEPFSLIDHAVVGGHSRIGPYARLRPGTVLQSEVHIGNFVEIKNSTIDSESKINHLSYIGDCTMGKKVNIGAGTITCNYDGVNKSRTVIGDGAFIGSDSQLIAPVTIAKGATIGAGSTISKDAPEDELTLSRAKQITVSGWKRPTKKAK